MKILNVSNIFFTLPYFFGEQLSYFTQKGYDISLVCGPDENLKPFAEKHGCKFKEIFIPRVISPVADAKALWRLYKYMCEERFDVVCGHTPIGGFLAIIAAWVCGVKKRVFFRHGLIYETSHGLKRKILVACEKVASLLSTHVVCVSPYLVERSLLDKLSSKEKMVLLHKGSCNGIDAEGKFNCDVLNKADLETIRKKCRLPKDAFVIGFVGRMVRDKGVEELVTAFKDIQKHYENAYLLLVGMLEERDALTIATVNEIRSNSHIIHTGLILEGIEYYYALMDVLVLCTHREGLGCALLEAAAMGVPTLTTSHSGSRDAVRENVTGMYVTMNDAQSIVDKVMMYIKDPELKCKHGEQGRQFILDTFQQEIIWDEIENKVYKS